MKRTYGFSHSFRLLKYDKMNARCMDTQLAANTKIITMIYPNTYYILYRLSFKIACTISFHVNSVFNIFSEYSIPCVIMGLRVFHNRFASHNHTTSLPLQSKCKQLQTTQIVNWQAFIWCAFAILPSIIRWNQLIIII